VRSFSDRAASSPASHPPVRAQSPAAAQAAGATRQIEVLRFWSDELAKPRYADPKCLLRHGFKVYSQADEDGIIQEIFNRIGDSDRAFVEFGVGSGTECNTVKLLVEGWHGLWIEASAESIAAIRRDLAPFIDGGRLLLRHCQVTAENIDAVISEAGVAGKIDLLSIDIDGNDYWVWNAVAGIQPRVVVVEYNATLHPPLSLVVPYDPSARWAGDNYFGASLEALVRLGRKKGYCIVACSFSGVNAFFVREDLCGEKFLSPPTAERHYEPPRYFFRPTAGHRARPGPYVAV
jgi:hypothetical protein